VVTRALALKNVSITSIMNGKSSCTKTATVTTVQYISMKPGTPPEPEIHDHTGEVVVHPDLELITGQSGRAQGVVWSNSDLAVIFLKEPLAAPMPRLKLTETEVQEGDAITMVGYSSGDDASPSYGARYFGDNRVNRLIQLETGSAVFRAEEQQLPSGGAASHTQGGDSGGACVKNGDPNVLVGIVTVGAEKPTGGAMSIFTSVYSHKRWLLQLLKRAEES
jgi:hypothetical protein